MIRLSNEDTLRANFVQSKEQMVKKNDGAAEKEEAVQESADEKNTLVHEVIKKLGLKETADMSQIISKFIDKQLPLLREQLIQFLQMAKYYDFPVEAVTNLASKNEVPRETELAYLKQLKDEGAKTLLPVIDEAIEGMGKSENDHLARYFLEKTHPLEFWRLLEEELPHLFAGDFSKKEELCDKEILGQVLCNSSFKELRKLNKKLAYISLFFDIDKLRKDGSESIKEIDALSKSLKMILRGLNKEETAHASAIEQLETTISVLEKYNTQAQYFCFPMLINEEECSGELYFFKPKKVKGNNKRGLYMVLALDLPALKKIEIHLIELEDKVTVKVKVMHSSIRDLIVAHEKVLLDSLKTADLTLGSLECELFEKEAFRSKEEITLHHMDLKV